MSKVSRRNLLKAGLAMSAAATLPVMTAPGASEARSSKDFEWSEEFDVIVVGTGLAGAAAGIVAAEKGNKTVLLDKMSQLGGTSMISGLNFACVGSELQRKEGIEDKPEWLANDMAKVAQGLGDYDLALAMARKTSDLYSFLSKRGVTFDGRLKKLGGHSVKRVVWPEGGGRNVMNALFAHIEKLPKAEIRNRTKVDELIMDNSGRVVGLKVREKYRFDTQLANDDNENTGGISRYYKASKGVVFATGGYSRDTDFRAAEAPYLRHVISTTALGSTAGALKSMIHAGAHPVHMTLMRFAFPVPTEDLRWGMMINPVTCKRFINEWQDRQTVANAILQEKLKVDGKNPVLIYDATGIENYHDKQRLELSLHGKNGLDGTMYKFDSLSELAQHFEIDSEKLEAAAKAYNTLVDRQEDPDFGKDMGKVNGSAIRKAPFYAMVANPRYNYTQGGVLINDKAEVLNIENGQPIEGFFAAGEAAGGMHGRIRLTACSMPECGVFGMIAGKSVALRSPVKA